MRLIRGQTSISVPKNNFRFSGKPRQPTPRQDQNRSHVQFPQSAHTESKELAPTFLRREVTNEALPQTDEGCGACGWFVSFLVGLRQGLVKLEIFLEATLA